MNIHLGRVVRRLVRKPIHILIATLLFCSTVASASETMPLSAIKKGMKGYGLTVFEGTKVERFDVEILGVLENIGPSQNAILARIDAPVVKRAGVIAGMSGSPIFIDGKVIGALAFTWQFAKEPVAGITPIDEMLKLADAGNSSTVASAAAPTMSGADFLSAIANGKSVEAFEKMVAMSFGGRRVGASTGSTPIAIPVSLSSFAPETIDRFGKYLGDMGFVAVPSGSRSTSSTTTTPASPFAPGDPVGAVLLNGDFTVAATGTVTHVVGDRVYAFGHPFLDMGSINFPMAKSEIVAVMPSLAVSFKMSNTGDVVGALRQDRASGIMGVLGEKADTIPVKLTVNGTQNARTYDVNLARHTQLSPLILAMVADTVVANVHRAAGERTVVLESEIKLKGYEPIRLREGWAGPQARQAIPAYLAVIAGYLLSNEFSAAEIESVTVNLHHDDELKIARIVEAAVIPPPNGRIQPGDTVKVRALLKPFRGESFEQTFDVTIPENQQPGNAYLLVGSGTISNMVDFSLVPPDPRNLNAVLQVLGRLRPATELTIGLYSSSDGAVAAGVYLPNLPPSMRAVVSGDTSNSAKAPVRYHASTKQARTLGYVIDGAVKIDVEIRPQT